MNKHFTITITDSEEGVKQYNLNKIVKKVLFYSITFLLFFMVVSVSTIYYLNKNVKESEIKKANIQKAYEELLEKNLNLQAKIIKTQEHLEAKKTELEEVSSSLAEIETLIGLKSTL